MSQFFRAGCCKSGDHALDSEEYIEKGNNLLKWKMPRVPTTKIYRRNRFRFSSDRSIKTEEGEVSFGNGSGTVNLINANPYKNFFRERAFYTMFNVGLIQIGVKTLTKKIPSNASIILYVRDTRREKFEASLLGAVETKLSDGPFYFNLFPNITMSLFDPKSWYALVLNVIVDGFEELPPGSEPISVVCRSCLKLQNDSEPHALLESPDGKTVFFQSDVEESNVTVQKVSIWNEVTCKLVSSAEERKSQKPE